MNGRTMIQWHHVFPMVRENLVTLPNGQIKVVCRFCRTRCTGATLHDHERGCEKRPGRRALTAR